MIIKCRLYELDEYGDVHAMNCYCVNSFLSVSVLQTSAIFCMRLKFDYQMAVYELYEYGDVHVVNCYCVSAFLSVSVFTDKCNILHEAKV